MRSSTTSSKAARRPPGRPGAWPPPTPRGSARATSPPPSSRCRTSTCNRRKKSSVPTGASTTGGSMSRAASAPGSGPSCLATSPFASPEISTPSTAASPPSSRPLKKAHLLRWRPRSHAQRTESTPRVRPSGAASHLDLFEPPASLLFVDIIRWLENDLRPDPLFGQDLEEDGVRHPAVDDMRLLGAARQRPERGLDLGQHASLDDLALHQALGLPLDQRRDVLAVIAHDPLHVGQVDELLRQERGGHVPRHEVGIDIVRLAPRAYSHGGDDGNEAARLEDANGLGIDALDLSHQPDVGEGAVGLTVHALSRADHGAVLAREPHGAAAVQVDQPDDLLVDLAHEHHLDDLHRLGIRYPHPAHEFRLLAQALHESPDLRASAVDDHRPHPGQPEEEDVAGELLLEVGLLHGRAAILDDQGLALEVADIGQRL